MPAPIDKHAWLMTAPTVTCRACERCRHGNGVNAGPRKRWKTADCVCMDMHAIINLDAARVCVHYSGNVHKGQVADRQSTNPETRNTKQ
jgi:hypothetical protein